MPGKAPRRQAFGSSSRPDSEKRDFGRGPQPVRRPQLQHVRTSRRPAFANRASATRQSGRVLRVTAQHGPLAGHHPHHDLGPLPWGTAGSGPSSRAAPADRRIRPDERELRPSEKPRSYVRAVDAFQQPQPYALVAHGPVRGRVPLTWCGRRRKPMDRTIRAPGGRALRAVEPHVLHDHRRVRPTPHRLSAARSRSLSRRRREHPGEPRAARAARSPDADAGGTRGWRRAGRRSSGASSPRARIDHLVRAAVHPTRAGACRASARWRPRGSRLRTDLDLLAAPPEREAEVVAVERNPR